ncbi:MAG TPA: class I SAM-dependent methyltransferase [Caulobacteraceae bacterium]|nr:class I SAM-dependent methyltransferase [Caulobacteraceae bacterium]
MSLEVQRPRYTDDRYVISQAAVMRSIERRVCGCDYGATSWTTREQAEEMGQLLGLQPGQRLLDVGAGAGWPGLYLAKMSGCDVALSDLPLAGLRIAAERASDDLSGRCWVAVADGASLPFRSESFDAISHSDALCCLPSKREVLEECRRVVRVDGAMAFTVIDVPPGLSKADYRRGVESGPQFIEADADYPTLLDETGWALKARIDLSAAYGETCSQMLVSYEQQGSELAELLGLSAYAEQRSKLAGALAAIRDGLQRRELLLARPC